MFLFTFIGLFSLFVCFNHCLEINIETMTGESFATFLLFLLLLLQLFVMENNAGSSGSIVYTREQLITLCRPMPLPGDL